MNTDKRHGLLLCLETLQAGGEPQMLLFNSAKGAARIEEQSVLLIRVIRG
jgi:hypothetical protein